MKFLAIVLTLGALLLPVAAQKNFHATTKKPAAKENAEPSAKESTEPATNCSNPAHAHRFYDMRLAQVEITSEDHCGFNYIDLETQTTGLDNHFQYDAGFLVLRTPGSKTDAQLIRSDVLPRNSLHRGTRGIAVYCSQCKTITMLKVIDE